MSPHWARSSGRQAVMALAAVLALSLTACSSGKTADPLSSGTSPPLPSPGGEIDAVSSEAWRFMDMFLNSDFTDQWDLLGPVARAQWPSAQARAAMLEVKFGATAINGVELGDPIPGATWTDPENLASHSELWRVPVGVDFANSSTPMHAGLSAAYRDMSLYLDASEGGYPVIVGEGPASLDAPVVLPAQIQLRRSGVPILMYHRVAPYPNPSLYRTPYDYRLDYGLTVGPAEFTGQVDYLAQNGYVAISLVRLADNLLYGLPLPPKAVIFTFDDGRASVMKYAVPELRKHGFTAVFLVPTGLMGGNSKTQHYLTAADVTQLTEEGFWVEDHTSADNVPLWGRPESVVQSIAGDSKQYLETLTGTMVQFIAYTGIWPYPSAAAGGPVELQLFSELRSMGYVGGLVDARQDSHLELSSQLWQLPRIRVIPNEALATFVSLL